MKIRPLIFLSAFSFMLIGLAGGLRAQQQDTGPAARRVIIFVWDGLRTDDLTPEITPNYFALAPALSLQTITPFIRPSR